MKLLQRAKELSSNNNTNNEQQFGSSFVWKYLDNFSKNHYDAMSAVAGHTGITIAPMAQPKGFVANFILTEYQLKAVAWLYNIEHSDRNMTCYKDLMCWHTRQGILYFDKKRKLLVGGTSLSSYRKIEYYARGGFFVAPKNRGRKAVILGLILATIDEVPNVEDKIQTGMQFSRATLIFSSETAEWIQEIKNTGLKVILDELPIHNNSKADIVLVSSYVDLSPHTAPKHSFHQFLWKRIVLHNLHAHTDDHLKKVKSLSALNWLSVSHNFDRAYPLSGSHPVDVKAMKNAMQLLGFPPQSAYEFVTRFTWKVPRKLADVDNHATFVPETIEVPNHPAEHYFPHMRKPEMTLDQAKVASLKNIKDILAKRIAHAARLDQICGDLYTHQVLEKCLNIYEGPPLMLSKLLPQISDAHITHHMKLKGIPKETNLDVSRAHVLVKQREKSVCPSAEKEPKFELLASLKMHFMDKGVYSNENIKAFILNTFGTKITTFLYFLQTIWEQDPAARVFVLAVAAEHLLNILDSMGITAGLITNETAGPKLPCWMKIPKQNKIPPIRVYLFDCSGRAFIPTASFAVSHIIFLDSLIKKESETRVLAGAYPQGDRKVVRIVRIYFKNSSEHNELYENNIVSTKPDDKEPAPSIDSLAPIAADSELGLMLTQSGALAKFAKLRNLVK